MTIPFRTEGHLLVTRYWNRIMSPYFERMEAVMTRNVRLERITSSTFQYLRRVALQHEHKFVQEETRTEILKFLQLPSDDRLWISFVWFFTRKLGIQSITDIFQDHSRAIEFVNAAKLGSSVDDFDVVQIQTSEEMLEICLDCVNFLNGIHRMGTRYEYVDLETWTVVRYHK